MEVVLAYNGRRWEKLVYNATQGGDIGKYRFMVK